MASEKDCEFLGADELLLNKKAGKRPARWSTSSVLKILGLSTAIQLCLYLGLNGNPYQKAAEDASSCVMAAEQELVIVERPLIPTAIEVVAEPIYADLVKYQATPTPTTSLLNVFQVYQPVLTPSGFADQTIKSDGSESTTTISPDAAGSSCEQTLMVHQFAFSFGEPFVGNYTPPSCTFNRVTINFTYTIAGRQFDRLGAMYFGDSEVWRFSTAEPTAAGIIATYIKDMTEFMFFWKSPQTLIFDLQNLVDDEFTGIFNTTLTATFFTSQSTIDEPASLILPISARNGAAGEPSIVMVPSSNLTNTISFPRNANRAVFSISSCGQASEEFWWGDVLQSDIFTFEPVDGTLFGFSPFREVQVFIDGQLAGVQWPFPIIFTGGVVPGLWRPIVGLDAYDLREHEIDITAFLPLLSDGEEHKFEIKVAGVLDDGNGSGVLTEAVLASWYVTGKIFIWQDDANSVTKGKAPKLSLPPPIITTTSKITQDATGANETLEYTIDVKRTLSISGTVQSQKGGPRTETWTQVLSYSNFGLYTDFGAVQLTIQSTNGTDTSSGATPFKTVYEYPVWVNTTFAVAPNDVDFTLDANITRSTFLTVEGSPVFPSGLQPFADLPASSQSLVAGLSGTHLSTTQNGTAHFASTGGISTGFGSTNQVFLFTGLDINGNSLDIELYSRDVAAVNSTVVKDVEVLLGKEIGGFSGGGGGGGKNEGVIGGGSPRQAIGRGSGKAVALNEKGSG